VLSAAPRLTRARAPVAGCARIGGATSTPLSGALGRVCLPFCCLRPHLLLYRRSRNRSRRSTSALTTAKTMWWSTWRTTWPAAAAGVVTAGGCVPLRSCCHSAQQQLLPSGTVVATTGSSAAVSTLHRGSWAGCLRRAASAGLSGPGVIGAVVRVEQREKLRPRAATHGVVGCVQERELRQATARPAAGTIRWCSATPHGAAPVQ